MSQLPSPAKWKSVKNDQYLCLKDRNKGILEFNGAVSSPIFTIENKGDGYVNIKHSETNLYLTGALKDKVWWIEATADTANTNRLDKNCTLFKTESVEQPPNTFRISHAYTGRYLRPYDVADVKAVLCAINSNKDPPEDIFTFTGN